MTDFKPEQFPAGYPAVVSRKAPGEPVQLIWKKEHVDFCLEADREPIDYPGAAADISIALAGLSMMKAQRALVIGSMSPWVEGMLLRRGVADAYTYDINAVDCEDSRIPVLDTKTLMELTKLRGWCDLIVSFSTIEHIGLGRYGDPLDDDGDLKFVREVVSPLLRTGGFFLCGVPVTEGPTVVEGNWHRLYGSDRLSTMLLGMRSLGGWTLTVTNSVKNGVVGPIDYKKPVGLHPWQNQPVIVCRKL